MSGKFRDLTTLPHLEKGRKNRFSLRLTPRFL